MRGPVAFVKNH